MANPARSGAVEAMKAAEVNGARAGFCYRSGAVGAMKTDEVNGARAGFCCRSGAGLASCRSYAGFGCRAERFEGRSRYNSLSPR